MERNRPDAEFLAQAREKLNRNLGVSSVRDYFDDHHVLHYRVEHTARPESKFLRAGMVAHDMWRPTHNLLHEVCPPVPVPNYQTLQYVLPRFRPELDIISKIDHLCLLVDQRRNHPKLKPMERQINDLHNEALQMQKPFIEDGLNRTNRVIIL